VKFESAGAYQQFTLEPFDMFTMLLVEYEIDGAKELFERAPRLGAPLERELHELTQTLSTTMNAKGTI